MRRKRSRPSQARLSRRNLLKATGGAVAGSLVACSESPPADEPTSDGGAAPVPDGGTDPLELVPRPAPDRFAEVDVDGGVEEPGPIFLLHWSDIHIGSGALAPPALEFALGTVLPAFAMMPIVATGDLVEVGNRIDDWIVYRDTIDAAGLSADDFMETPGNHDALLDAALNNYLAYTLAGRNGHGRHGLYHRVHQGRRVRIVALNTCSSGNPLQDSTGYLQLSQVEELIAQIDLDPDPVYATLVLGHHPPSSPLGLGLYGTDAHLRTLLTHTSAAAYLHGHVHMHYVNWEGTTVMAQAPSLGNPSEGVPGAEVPGFNVFALDDGPVAKPVFFTSDAQGLAAGWPVVLITKPADVNFGKTLTSTDPNPWATPLPRAATGNVLHAGVFAPTAPVAVRYRVSGGPWQPMTAVSDYYRAEFDTPDESSCVIEVEGELGDGAIGADSIEIDLA
ncbi:MAG: metallophosphoesterase [Deltaproteobacteria bacterium]|jgi:hypothetical protein|nr:metallophosphoesterase [Deltaproteobacteria bacterium]MBW2533089.1 metallophosphoesterase [Deltaproteobacteria bacterium]